MSHVYGHCPTFADLTWVGNANRCPPTRVSVTRLVVAYPSDGVITFRSCHAHVSETYRFALRPPEDWTLCPSSSSSSPVSSPFVPEQMTDARLPIVIVNERCTRTRVSIALTEGTVTAAGRGYENTVRYDGAPAVHDDNNNITKTPSPYNITRFVSRFGEVSRLENGAVELDRLNWRSSSL